jgi:hypothetical protein
MQSDVARIKPEMEFGTNSFTGRAAGPPLLYPLPVVIFENAKLRALEASSRNGANPQSSVVPS